MYIYNTIYIYIIFAYKTKYMIFLKILKNVDSFLHFMYRT